MLYTKTQNGYMLRLIKGEELSQTLVLFCEKHQIKSAFFQAIGATTDVELGYYHLETKTYIWKKLTQEMELVSLTGNIAQVDEKPFAHMHGVFSDENFSTVGGHIKQMIVGATCEVYLTDFGTEITRVMDEEIGLKLLHCETQAQ